MRPTPATGAAEEPALVERERVVPERELRVVDAALLVVADGRDGVGEAHELAARRGRRRARFFRGLDADSVGRVDEDEEGVAAAEGIKDALTDFTGIVNGLLRF